MCGKQYAYGLFLESASFSRDTRCSITTVSDTVDKPRRHCRRNTVDEEGEGRWEDERNEGRRKRAEARAAAPVAAASMATTATKRPRPRYTNDRWPKYFGVQQKRNRWQAQPYIDGEQIYLGMFCCQELAWIAVKQVLDGAGVLYDDDGSEANGGGENGGEVEDESERECESKGGAEGDDDGDGGGDGGSESEGECEGEGETGAFGVGAGEGGDGAGDEHVDEGTGEHEHEDELGVGDGPREEVTGAEMADTRSPPHLGSVVRHRLPPPYTPQPIDCTADALSMTVGDSGELARLKRELVDAQDAAKELERVKRELAEAREGAQELARVTRELAESQDAAKELARVKEELAKLEKDRADDREFYGPTIQQHLIFRRLVTDVQVALVEADVPTMWKSEKDVEFWVKTGGSYGTPGPQTS